MFSINLKRLLQSSLASAVLITVYGYMISPSILQLLNFFFADHPSMTFVFYVVEVCLFLGWIAVLFLIVKWYFTDAQAGFWNGLILGLFVTLGGNAGEATALLIKSFIEPYSYVIHFTDLPTLCASSLVTGFIGWFFAKHPIQQQNEQIV